MNRDEILLNGDRSTGHSNFLSLIEAYNEIYTGHKKRRKDEEFEKIKTMGGGYSLREREKKRRGVVQIKPFGRFDFFPRTKFHYVMVQKKI